MQAEIFSYPPLGQVTKVTVPEVSFTCVLNLDLQCMTGDWQVLLRYTSIGSDTWQEDILTRSERHILKSQGQKDPTRIQLSFETKILITAAIRFETRARHGSKGAWITALGDSKLDSIVTLADVTDSRNQKLLDINDYISDLNPELRSRLLGNDLKSNVTSWIVEVPVEAAQGEAAHMTQVMFGKPFGGEFLSWFAISRNTTSWMAPRQGRTYFKLDVAAILCSFVSVHGQHLIVLGISGFENVMAIFGDDNGGALMIKIRNEREAPGLGRVILAVGINFEETLAYALSQARAMFTNTSGPNNSWASNPIPKLSRDWADHWMNGLIYSPFSSVVQKISLHEIMDGLKDLEAKGIIVSSLILENGWQKVDQNAPSRYHAGLVDFDTDPAAFKLGLKHAITDIKGQHRSVRNIIVNHPIFGYWGGVSEDPNGPLRQSYEIVHVQRSETIQPGPKTVLSLALVSSRDVKRFFKDYYKFLLSCGVSAVQTEGIYMLETLNSAVERCALSESYLDAQSAASLEYFPGGTLASMSLSPSALFNSLKSTQAGQQVVRNSAIFPDHRKHVFNNAVNALLSRAIGNIPDWGPVQSTKDNGAFHLAARVISGGPIQIKSFDGSSAADLDVVRRVSGRTANGKIVVLRPTGIGRTVNPYVGFEDCVLLKIGNTHVIGTLVVSILGTFNVSDRALSEILDIKDFPGVDPAKEYLVTSNSGIIGNSLKVDGQSLILVNLEPSSYEFLCAYPLTTLTNPQSETTIHVATLGVREKLLGAAAILDTNFSIEKGLLGFRVVLKVLGALDLYISDLPRRTIKEGTCNLTLQGRIVTPSIQTIRVTDRILRLDLESIWSEQKIESESDEIYVEFTIPEI
ncbi:raffinose synthase or seed imbibition protein Sip1-domain-containing protein [Truncatella angustata]|uniref:Raffinose synthase or seed imbibition protein Sip1-domain-containing protein n=1 Tax=Truncatella angustata TaxID=152316 RepID=A0A9P8UJC4_9PEZI|nr:raffinose synthase or seed imbibition protein Sip1-domain-containing protein [Truncatella angustata]KAH6653197.1 raffinose synthase or seed imbibition protein Sip1-domain-containing protein [Truncatella angustata]